MKSIFMKFSMFSVRKDQLIIKFKLKSKGPRKLKTKQSYQIKSEPRIRAGNADLGNTTNTHVGKCDARLLVVEIQIETT